MSGVAPEPHRTALPAEPLLDVSGLSKVFGAARGWLRTERAGIRAVDDVSFRVAPGETLGIVGESGSGKSTVARMVLRLVEPTGGSVALAGEDIAAMPERALRHRRRGIQMVFQDPYSSLNPRLRIGAQVAEPLKVHGIADGTAAREHVAALLSRVGLDPERADDFPHAFSGGQRQRIAIARALATEPRLVVADEAVSALDVSVRGQILNLLAELKETAALSMLFISHDLGVVRHVADAIAVMFRGRVVEIGPTERLFAEPRHPYTVALLSAMPAPFPGARPRHRVPDPGEWGAAPDGGCAYAARCPLAIARCRRERPELAGRQAGHVAACHRADDVTPPPPASRGRSAGAAERLRRLQAPFLARGRESGEAVP